MYDVAAIGELLIDFTPSGQNGQGAMLFARNPGGAPANVLAAVSKLGGRSAFIGKVGDDMFGHFLKDTLIKFNISDKGLVFSKTTNTTLAFVQLDESGERSFSFYRNPGADMMLESDDVNQKLLESCKILHFGSISLTHEPARSATFSAIKRAKANGAIISYDPNYRPPLWESEDTARKQMIEGLAFADILKVSEEELLLLTNTDDLEKGSAMLAERGISLILVSLGGKGSFYRMKELCNHLPSYVVDTIDTNGAGDAFLGAVLYQLRSKSLDDIHKMSKEQLNELMMFANAAGALATTKSGAIGAAPSIGEIENLRRI